MAYSLADLLLLGQQMVTALTSNQTEVTKRGGTVEFVADGQAKIDRVRVLDSEQEALKAACPFSWYSLRHLYKMFGLMPKFSAVFVTP